MRRDEWPAIADAFQDFFAGAGEVEVGDDLLRFVRPGYGTGLELRRDGTSTSFMPLHGLEARWERVQFDRIADEVVLEADGVSYTYRVPPSLRT